MKCVVVTPERTEVESETRFVAIPLFDGEYAAGPLHSPMIGRLGAGELRITRPDGGVDRWYVEGGFVEILGDTVTLMTSRAVGFGKLSAEAASESLAFELGKKTDGTDESFTLKENQVRRARARVRTAQKWNHK